jgi:predicted heme/steroid binding protein
MKRTILAICLFVLFLPALAFASVEYSRQTGEACGACHVEYVGGGPLTDRGESFKDDLRIKGLYRPLTTAQHVVRLIVGYLHTMTAIIWFGAILYVHILLKPAYAARGLPRGELMVGWASIVIMAITGTLLTIARVPSVQMLYTTRFGILLLIKVGLFAVMATTAAVTTFIIGPKLRKKRKALALEQGKQDLTAEELSQFDGKEGRPAYVAYKENIYEVTKGKLWKEGLHVSKHLAGMDLTDALRQAPHGEENITAMPLVGKLVALREKPARPTHQKVFYFFAYMNLALVFLIVFVISLWRWW